MCLRPEAEMHMVLCPVRFVHVHATIGTRTRANTTPADSVVTDLRELTIANKISAARSRSSANRRTIKVPCSHMQSWPALLSVCVYAQHAIASDAGPCRRSLSPLVPAAAQAVVDFLE